MSQDQKKALIRNVVKIVIVFVLVFLVTRYAQNNQTSQQGDSASQSQQTDGQSQSGKEDELTTADGTTLTTPDDSEKKETVYTFRNKYLLDEHFEKHGGEFDYADADEYENGASAVVNDPKALHKTEKDDGDDIYYLEKTNELVIVSTDGYIRTYFRPDSGIKYYNRQ